MATIAGLALLGMQSLALASTETGSDDRGNGTQMQTRAQSGESGIKNQIKQNACAKRGEQVTKRVEQYDKMKRAHVQAYNNMQERVKKFIDKLKEKGFDTTKLQADLVVLNGKVIKFANDYSSYISKLDEARKLGCDDAAALKVKMQEARDLLKIVHDDCKDIHSYYNETIKADITALKKS